MTTPMTFEQWQATRKWVDRLADVTGLDHADYPSGWIYRDGAEHIESIEWGCRVVIEQSEREFKELEDAERYLWDEWARDEANGPNIDSITASDVAYAATKDSLDDACLHLQTIANITDGGGAGIYFSGPAGDDWPMLSCGDRAKHLRAWLQTERVAP